MDRRHFLSASMSAAALLAAPAARAEGVLKVAYAGSMGVLMDKVIGPAFGTANNATFQGTGAGAFGLARLLAAKKTQSDVFVSVTPGPMELLLKAGLVKQAVAVASTAMVIAYSPKSHFAPDFKAAADAKGPWWQVLQSPKMRFGRTDPMTDPQGRNIIFTLELAEIYYKIPGLARTILGTVNNPAQIFTETSLLSRLETGELDATSGYQSAVTARGLPMVILPPEINLSDPKYYTSSYSKAMLPLAQPDGTIKTAHPEPLVFYAGVLQDAPSPDLGNKFVAFLTSEQGQAMFKQGGYGPPKGSNLG